MEHNTNTVTHVASILRNALQNIENLSSANIGNNSSSSSPEVTAASSRSLAFTFAPSRTTASSASSPLAAASAVARDFRSAFPSLGGGGQRFIPSKRTRRSASCNKDTWTHDFCLLAKKADAQTPDLQQINHLQQAGMGKKRITFPRKGDHTVFIDTLESTFPKLSSQNGAIELMRAERGGRQCKLIEIPMSPKGYTVQCVRESIGATSVVYIRPMQSDLPLTKVFLEIDESLKTECTNCKMQVPLAEIKSHLRSCTSTEDLLSLDEELTAEEDLASTSYYEDSVPGNSTVSVASGKSCKLSSCIASVSRDDSYDQDTATSQLESLFPNLSKEKISEVVQRVASVDEAANVLMDSDEQNSNKQLVSSVNEKRDPQNVHTILNRLAESKHEQSYEEISVDRDAIWQDVLRFYKRKVQNGDLKKTLEVKFKDEDGLDGGALRCEFFHLALAEVRERLFEGNPLNLVPKKDSTQLFYMRIAGMLITHLLIQDGPLEAIPTISPAVVAALFEEPKDVIAAHMSKHHIPLNAATENIHNLIEELDIAHNEADIKKVLFSSDLRDVYWHIIGSCHWPISTAVTMHNKDVLIHDIIYNELISSRREEIGELKEGLQVCGFKAEMQAHREVLQQLFLHNNDLRRPLSLNEVRRAITSEPNSLPEHVSLDWLLEYLENDREDANMVGGRRITAFLMFCTGKMSRPRNMKSKIQIKFLPEEKEYVYPTVSACMQILRLPTSHRSKQDFHNAIDTALKHSATGFPIP